MNDKLLGFDSVIKKLYLENYDAICQFAQDVLSKMPASSVQVYYEEAKFSEYVAKLDYNSDREQNSGLNYSFNFELMLGWENRNTLAGRICGCGVGALITGGGKREFTVVELGQHKLLFLRWDEDATQIFWSGQLVGKVNGILGKRIEIQNSGGNSMPIIYPSWPWQKTRVCIDEKFEILFPPVWPNPDGLPERMASTFATIPFEKQMLIVATLLWKNAHNGPTSN